MKNRRQKRQERRQQRKLQAEKLNSPLENASLLFQSGKPEQAGKILEEFLGNQPDNFDALGLLGVIRATSGDPSGAASLFEKAAEVRPDDAVNHINLALAYEELRKFDEAIDHYRRSLEIDPNNEAINFNLGNLLKSHNDFMGAAACYNRALEINPADPWVHCNLGNVLVKLGQLNDAVVSYKRGLEIDSGLAPIHSNLGEVLEKQGRLDDAAASQARAIEIDPNYTNAYCSLGIAYYKLGRLSDSITIFQRALAINSELAGVWDHLMFAIKARQFSNVQSDHGTDSNTYGLNGTTRSHKNFVMLEYYLKKFRPHEIDENFEKAVTALPSKTDEEVTVMGAGDETPDHHFLPDNMVTLLHYGRSGTGLLHSLIDGHPEISTIPSIYLRGFFNNGIWGKISAQGWHELPEQFADEFAVLFDAMSPKPTPGRLGEDSVYLGKQEGMTNVGDDRNESLSLDRDSFCAEALRLIKCFDKINPEIFLLIIHVAFEKALVTKTEKHTVFYHIHNPDDLAKLNFLRYFPDARLVMMVREPIQNCESWIRSHFNKNDYDQIVHKINSLLLDFHQVEFRVQNSVGVRLEDLKSQPEKTLRSLCGWLGIKENPSLYEMTAQGKKWWGDPASLDYDETKAMEPFDATSTNRPVGTILNDRDQFVFRTLFYPFSVRFGYREPDHDQFKKDLRELRPQLDDMLDFEKVMSERLNIHHDQFKKSGAYLLLRACFLDRWDVLNQFGDYPHMITPLDID